MGESELKHGSDKYCERETQLCNTAQLFSKLDIMEN